MDDYQWRHAHNLDMDSLEPMFIEESVDRSLFWETPENKEAAEYMAQRWERRAQPTALANNDWNQSQSKHQVFSSSNPQTSNNNLEGMDLVPEGFSFESFSSGQMFSLEAETFEGKTVGDLIDGNVSFPDLFPRSSETASSSEGPDKFPVGNPMASSNPNGMISSNQGPAPFSTLDNIAISDQGIADSSDTISRGNETTPATSVDSPKESVSGGNETLPRNNISTATSVESPPSGSESAWTQKTKLRGGDLYISTPTAASERPRRSIRNTRARKDTLTPARPARPPFSSTGCRKSSMSKPKQEAKTSEESATPSLPKKKRHKKNSQESVPPQAPQYPSQTATQFMIGHVHVYLPEFPPAILPSPATFPSPTRQYQSNLQYFRPQITPGMAVGDMWLLNYGPDFFNPKPLEQTMEHFRRLKKDRQDMEEYSNKEFAVEIARHKAAQRKAMEQSKEESSPFGPDDS